MNRDELMKLSEWPTRAEDVSADALIRHGARLAMSWSAEMRPLSRCAFSLDADDPARPDAMRRYVDAVTAMIAEAQVTALLVAMQGSDRALADAYALMLWELTEDGGVLHELMFDYLDARGVPAGEMWEAIEALTAEEHRPSEPGTRPSDPSDHNRPTKGAGMSFAERRRARKVRRLEDQIADLGFEIATRGPISLPSRVRQREEYRDRLRAKLEALTDDGAGTLEQVILDAVEWCRDCGRIGGGHFAHCPRLNEYPSEPTG